MPTASPSLKIYICQLPRSRGLSHWPKPRNMLSPQGLYVRGLVCSPRRCRLIRTGAPSTPYQPATITTAKPIWPIQYKDCNDTFFRERKRMGFQERPYYQDNQSYGPRGGGSGGISMPRLPNAVKYLLIINVVVFIMQSFDKNGAIVRLFAAGPHALHLQR